MGNLNSTTGTTLTAPRQHPVKEVSPALYAFIEEECPSLNRAVVQANPGRRQKIIKAFNEHFRHQKQQQQQQQAGQNRFQDIRQILLFVEKERLHRVGLLSGLSTSRFHRVATVDQPFVYCKINGKIALAIVDTGSDSSVMTKESAEAIGLLRTVNRSIQGAATGFGHTSAIIGALPDVPIEFANNLILNVEFLVIEKSAAGFVLFGANFLRKHKCRLDFQKGEAKFPATVVKEEAVKFAVSRDKEKLNLSTDGLEALVRRTLLVPPNIKEPNTTFIGVKVNGIPVKAFLDTGSDCSVISQAMAVRLKVMKYAMISKVSVRFGLGSVPRIGKIPPIPVEFDRDTVVFVPFDLIGVEISRSETILLGCDFLTWFGCIIDFQSNTLNIPMDKPKWFTLGGAANIDKREKSSETSQAVASLSSYKPHGGKHKSPYDETDSVTTINLK